MNRSSSVHTKLVNPLTKTASFLKLFTRAVSGPVHTDPQKKGGGGSKISGFVWIRPEINKDTNQHVSSTWHNDYLTSQESSQFASFVSQEMHKAAKRVCVIGAGPSGMSALYQFKQLEMKGQEIPEIVCFDKQSDWGGLWKYSWQTGEKLVVVLFFSSCFHILITKQTTARCYWLPGRHMTCYNKTLRRQRSERGIM